MAKRSERAAPKQADTQRAGDVRVAPPLDEDAGGHLLVFRIADDLFGFKLDDVGEIIRLPALAYMPLGPKSLLGLANLRGMVLPVVDIRLLLGFSPAPLDDAARVIVIGGGAPVAFVVDRIEALRRHFGQRGEQDGAGAGAVDPDLLDGVVKGAEGDRTVKILNPQRMLRDEFARLGVSEPRAASRVSMSAGAPNPAAPEQPLVALVSFDLGRQEYALPLDRVREIIPLPDQVSQVPRAETAVLGFTTLRDRLLPLVSLRMLLGLPPDTEREERGKVVVLSMGGATIGMVADRTREILRIDPSAIDPAPTLLTRGAGDAEITSICRLEQGKRLVALLSPDRLFRSELVRRVLAEKGGEIERQESPLSESTMADEQFVIFRLGNQEYGLPIGAVDEIARPPDHITRLPKAPAFIDGVINLRGIVVPIVDLRRRFELMSQEPVSTQRILVLAIGGGKTGFMVDSVSEVLKVPAAAIRPAPEVSREQMRLIGRVANLDAQARMILLVDPAQLLDRVEADVLAKFDRADPEQASNAS
ncbi:MAG: purine-binding chemotaxis protein CheW [Alphaproteobacteria bacterium]|nr:purine-binding chemotaxis protein CheW [Alphaproteobacteria bacterium]